MKDDYSKYSDEELKKEENLLKSRVSKLNNGQMARKILLNSLYGALANKYFRYFDLRMASAITLSGQMSIKWIEKYLTEHNKQKIYGWDIVYCDTDSAYIDLHKVAIKLKQKNPNITQKEITNKLESFTQKIILPIVHVGYDELAKYMNCNENRMQMALEKICVRAFWVGRKKYAMLVASDEGVHYLEPVLKVKGIEIVRSSTPKVIRESLKIAVKYLLEDIDKFYSFVDQYRKEFNKFSIEEISFPRSVNNLEKYKDGNGYKKGTPIAVRAAFTFNKFIKKYNLLSSFNEIRSGEKVKFIYMKVPNPVYENVFAFIKRFPTFKNMEKFVDRDLQFEKAFSAVIKKMCDHLKIPFKKNTNSINNLFD